MLLFNVCYLVFKDQDAFPPAPLRAAEANSIETDPNCQGLFYAFFSSRTTDSWALKKGALGGEAAEAKPIKTQSVAQNGNSKPHLLRGGALQ